MLPNPLTRRAIQGCIYFYPILSPMFEHEFTPLPPPPPPTPTSANPGYATDIEHWTII